MREDLLIQQALQSPQQGGYVVPVQRGDKVENMPVEVATFEVLKSLLNIVNELAGVMLSVHHHLAFPERKAQLNRDHCNVCQQIFAIQKVVQEEQAKQEEESETDSDS